MSRPFLTPHERSALFRALRTGVAGCLAVGALILFATIATYDGDDPSVLNATARPAQNALGANGAQVSSDMMTWLGLGSYAIVGLLVAWASWIVKGAGPKPLFARLFAAPVAVLALSAFASAHGGQIAPGAGLGGYVGDVNFRLFANLLWFDSPQNRLVVGTLLLFPLTLWLLVVALGGGLSGSWRAMKRMTIETRRAAGILNELIRSARPKEEHPPIYQSEPTWTPAPTAPPLGDVPSFDGPLETARLERAPRRQTEDPDLNIPAPEEPAKDGWTCDWVRPRKDRELPVEPEFERTTLFYEKNSKAPSEAAPTGAENRRRPPNLTAMGEPTFAAPQRPQPPRSAPEERPLVSQSRETEPKARRVRSFGLNMPDLAFEPQPEAQQAAAPVIELHSRKPEDAKRSAATMEEREQTPFIAPKRPQARSWTIGRPTPGYAPPTLDRLESDHSALADPDFERTLAQKAERLQRVINEFGVRGDVIDVNPGPVVTQFELEPGPGVKVARVVSLADDIARAMSAVSARVATIPGKNVIGIELPNDERQTIRLRDLLEDPKFIAHAGALPIALGSNLVGEPVTVDLARAPHLLIAGATGAGKSVAVNAILLSLLYRLNPTELRLLLIDPKMLELSIYNGAPHLLSPVVTDAKEALQALKWAVQEMERRYELMSKLGVRGVDGYNKRAETLRRSGGMFEFKERVGASSDDGRPVMETKRIPPDPMARIVVIIDEMADLMMVSGKEIEHCVLRLAQMGRASGIHLIAATQRPSVDVITGLIKSNFPTRISFQTASAADSKTILDRPGAERLLGKGDMLFSPGGAQLERLHGAFVSDEEVAAITDHLKEQGPADDQISFSSIGDGDGFSEDEEYDGESGEDALYERARRIVLSEQRASASFLQRRLSVGYNRASRLIEQMEQEGVVSPLTSAGKREVLAPDNAVAAK